MLPRIPPPASDQLEALARLPKKPWTLCETSPKAPNRPFSPLAILVPRLFPENRLLRLENQLPVPPPPPDNRLPAALAAFAVPVPPSMVVVMPTTMGLSSIW